MATTAYDSKIKSMIDSLKGNKNYSIVASLMNPGNSIYIQDVLLSGKNNKVSKDLADLISTMLIYQIKQIPYSPEQVDLADAKSYLDEKISTLDALRKKYIILYNVSDTLHSRFLMMDKPGDGPRILLQPEELPRIEYENGAGLCLKLKIT